MKQTDFFHLVDQPEEETLSMPGLRAKKRRVEWSQGLPKPKSHGLQDKRAGKSRLERAIELLAQGRAGEARALLSGKK